MQNRRYEQACDFLQDHKLRYSRQRMVVISELFFNKENEKRHFKVNELLHIIQKKHKNVSISTASLTNILKGLCDKGFIREIYANRLYYDTIVHPHIHFYDEDNDILFDAPDDSDLSAKDILSKINVPNNYNAQDINIIISVGNYKKVSKM